MIDEACVDTKTREVPATLALCVVGDGLRLYVLGELAVVVQSLSVPLVVLVRDRNPLGQTLDPEPQQVLVLAWPPLSPTGVEVLLS